jgi:hypothetical protein
MSNTYTVNPNTVYNGGAVTGGISNDTITLTSTGAGSSHTVLGGAGGGVSLTGGGGGAGSTIYSVGTSTNYTTNWATPNTTFNGGNGQPVMTMPPGESTIQIEKEATLDVKGNLVINGVDLEKRLRTIEKVLAIPDRDVILEEKHPKLKELYEEYINALEKYRTWERIKGEE